MADVFEDEAEPTVSLNEYLNDVEEQELEADLVLGGDEGKECTYSKGYMKRQALFSCLTCTPDGNAGVCTACSLSCHDGHEIVELWTKRNFRCDCGNSKFGDFLCKLLPSKDVENVDNSYNHNFKGAYCTCGRPYPDPDATEQEEMIQCCICEDWFHEEHLGLESSIKIPRDDEGEPLYEDLICHKCSVICSFLNLYPQTIWAAAGQPMATKSLKEKEVAEGGHPLPGGSMNQENGNCSHDVSVSNIAPTVTAGTSVLGENDKDVTASRESKCILGLDLSEASADLEKGRPMFLTKSWREILCRCEKCTDFYRRKGIGFLLVPEDSIAEYEKMAKEKRDEKLQQQQGMEQNFLNKLGHVEKMEILHGIADMKNEIHAFLESFDTSKPITSADIHQVFENLAKKRKREL